MKLILIFLFLPFCKAIKRRIPTLRLDHLGPGEAPFFTLQLA